MGAAYGASCFATDAAARQAHCEQGFPRDAIEGGEAVSYACAGITTTTLQLARSSTAASAPVAVELTTSYAICDETNVTTAVISPSMAAAAWGYGFSGVLICYLFAYAAGRVLDAIRG